MQTHLWIIDGYNLIRREPRLRDAEERHGTAGARAWLESRLIAFLGREGRGHAVALVYDGGPDPYRAPPRHRALRVLHPPRGRSADDLILAEARRAGGSAQVTVVTSDLADIGRALRGLRVRHQTVAEFAPLLFRGEGADLPAGSEKPSTVDGKQVDEWLRRFGADAAPEERT